VLGEPGQISRRANGLRDVGHRGGQSLLIVVLRDELVVAERLPKIVDQRRVFLEDLPEPLAIRNEFRLPLDGRNLITFLGRDRGDPVERVHIGRPSVALYRGVVKRRPSRRTGPDRFYGLPHQPIVPLEHFVGSAVSGPDHPEKCQPRAAEQPQDDLPRATLHFRLTVQTTSPSSSSRSSSTIGRPPSSSPSPPNAHSLPADIPTGLP